LFGVIQNVSLKDCIIQYIIHLFKIYRFITAADVPQPVGNPCIPSPCGPNSQCKVQGNSPSCSCLPEFIGSPPNCKPECISNSECPIHLSCMNMKCKNPCIGACAPSAECKVISHTPRCSCPVGYIGNPLSECSPQQGK